VVKKVKTKKNVKAVKKIYKRPNINLLISVAVMLVALGIVLFQVNQSQDFRGRAVVAANDCTVSDADVMVTSQEHVLIDLVNQYRQANGAPALSLALSLNRSATWLSKDMNASKNLSHTDSLGRSFFQRFIDCGQPQNSGGEENLFQGTGGAQAAFDWWKASTQGHNEAMLRPTNLFAGIGNDGDYWVLTLSPVEGSDTISPGVTVPVSPTAIVPSQQCLGSCLNLTPTTGSPTVTVVPTVVPTAIPSANPSANPSINPSAIPTTGISPTVVPTPGVTLPVEPTQPVGNPSPGGQQGLIGLLLAFLMLILEFFKSLFGR
jgi:hypothetical protein